MSSLIAEVMQMVAFELEESLQWATPPRLMWAPDLDRAELREATSPVAVVLPPEMTLQPSVRDKSGAGQTLQIHLAIIRGSTAGTFAEGEAVVLQAETAAKYFMHGRFPMAETGRYAACLEAALEPVISAQFLKELGLWVSYVKLEFLVEG